VELPRVELPCVELPLVESLCVELPREDSSRAECGVRVCWLERRLYPQPSQALPSLMLAHTHFWL
jgi:hypothetical protein